MSDITDLCKQGDLDSARHIAQERLAESPKAQKKQNDYGWVLYYLLKRDMEAFSEKKITLGNLLHTLNHVAEEYRRLDALRRPDLLHSLLFTQIVKVGDEWPGYIAFARWWGMGNFRREDQQPFQPTDGGRPIPSLEMRALHAVGKALALGHIDKEDTEWALALVDEALHMHPDDIWLNYHKAKYLIGCSRGQESLQFILPVAMRNLRASWVWGLLGQIVEPDDVVKAIICYYRAIQVADKQPKTLKIRLRLIRLLAMSERFAEAATQVIKVKDIRIENSWAINQELTEFLDAAWFKQHEASADAKVPDMEGPAMEILCDLFPAGFERKQGVLESHNKAKELAYVSFSATEGMSLPYRYHKGIKKHLPGTVLDLSVFTGDDRSRVISVRVSKMAELPGFMRHLTGSLQLIDGKPFGFVILSDGERVYIAPDILNANKLSSGASVSGVALRSIDRKTGKEGWKMIHLVGNIVK